METVSIVIACGLNTNDMSSWIFEGVQESDGNIVLLGWRPLNGNFDKYLSQDEALALGINPINEYSE